MDENIKVAAGYLQNAVANMQTRIRDIQSTQTIERNQESHEEDSIGNELRLLGADIMFGGMATMNRQEVARREQALRSRRSELQRRLNQHLNDEQREIQSLQSQITRLNGLVRQLEYW